MRVLICGSRTMPAYHIRLMVEIIERLAEKPSCIIEGGATGADSNARSAAKILGIPVSTFVADWTKHGKAAGFIRNKQMIDDGKPDFVLAFYPESGVTSGTANMIKLAHEAGLHVQEFKY